MTNPISNFTYIGVPDPEHAGMARLAGDNFNRSWYRCFHADGTNTQVYLYHGDEVWHNVFQLLRLHGLDVP